MSAIAGVLKHGFACWEEVLLDPDSSFKLAAELAKEQKGEEQVQVQGGAWSRGWKRRCKGGGGLGGGWSRGGVSRCSFMCGGGGAGTEGG